MKRIIFDLETDGLLDKVKKIHVIGAKDANTGEPFIFSTTAGNINKGIELLSKADVLIGHNIINYDVPVLNKLYPQLKLTNKMVDTLILSRIQHAHDMFEHSIDAWGKKLKLLKGDFGKTTDWKECTSAMVHYCVRDVDITYKLYLHLMKNYCGDRAYSLEVDFFKVLDRQMKQGVYFDLGKAEQIARNLEVNIEKKKEEILRVVPSLDKTVIKVYKKDYNGIPAGTPIPTTTQIPFNPGSRTQIIEFFRRKYNWIPETYTDKNNPSINSEVLDELPFAEAPLFASYLEMNKLYGAIANGDKAWIKSVVNGKIHGYIKHNGAATHRCTHSNPNLGQIPSVGSFMGKECRALFTVPEGYSMVGADASQLELRNLAHYMHPWDNGEYTRAILSGDIHTHNQKGAGLETRDLAKKFIYAHNYGAGNKKLGNIMNRHLSDTEKIMLGASAREKFMVEIPAMKNLIQAVQRVVKQRGYIIGLDGRKIYPPSDHTCLNYLLQGAGAVLMKQWWVLVWEGSDKRGFDAQPLLHVHDEGQSMVLTKDAEEFGKMKTGLFTNLTEIFNYKCPLAGDYKVGRNWAETH